MPNIPKPTGINEVWASTGVKQPATPTKTASGWVVEYPPYQMMNWLQNKQDSFIAHSNQHGIPEWDADTEYQGNVSISKGSDGIVYKAIATTRGANPIDPLNRLFWVRAFEPFGVVANLTTVVENHISNYQTLAGISNIVAARNNLSVFSKTESDARFASIGGSSTVQFSIAASTLPQHAIRRDEVLSFLNPATNTAAGIMRFATTSEVEIGGLGNVAVSPETGTAVYLKKTGNLVGLTNPAIARSNLGLSPIATVPIANFLQTSNNLGDVPDKAVARSNLGLTTTATRQETYFLRTDSNLIDVPNKPAARTNLGLSSLATTGPETVLFKSGNLAGLGNVAQARNNLGLGNAATADVSSFLARASNLSDLTNTQAARNNLSVASFSETQAMSVGAGKTWQNMLPSRQPGVTYTNDTGGPIMLALSAYSIGGTQHFLRVQGFEMYWLHSDSRTGQSGTISMIIPAGNTYSVNTLPATWLELR